MSRHDITAARRYVALMYLMNVAVADQSGSHACRSQNMLSGPASFDKEVMKIVDMSIRSCAALQEEEVQEEDSPGLIALQIPDQRRGSKQRCSFWS
jgi:hypothetical protein